MEQSPPKLARLASFASWMTVVAGFTILAGWQFRIPVLKGQALGTFVAPNTALSFALSGISILLLVSDRRWMIQLGTFLAICVTAFALATGAEYLFQIDLGIDRVVMAHRLSDWNLTLPGRYTINTLIGFILTGISLFTLRRTSGTSWAEISAGFVMLVSYLSIVALLLGASVLYDHVMAVHTAVLFALLAVALLTNARRQVLLGTLLSPFAGAVASRKMILTVVTLLPLLGGLELWAEGNGWVSLRLGTALSVIISVTIFTVLALRTAAVLNETDRKRIEGEAALLKSNQLAVAGRMAASIAHEVNNPLESVTNLMFLLKSDGINPEARREYLDIAERELHRVAAIARRTLAFYREESKESPVKVHELLDGVLEVYRNKLNNSIVVRKEYSENATVVVKVGEVRQVLTNLVANAIDALHGRGGVLTLGVEANNGLVTITVQDNGPGISDEHLEKIYEPFFTTKKNTGTGLGLWVTKELVKKNGGMIEVESSTNPANPGTRFKVSFPTARTEEGKQTSSAEAST